MNPGSNQFSRTSLRLITAAALVSTMIFAPAAVFAAGKDMHQDRVEQRIKEMHTKLKITAAEEAQWNKVAEVMRDDAKNMDALRAEKIADAPTMTAVDDLKAYSELAQAHVDGIKKLIPVFEDLYSSLSPAQKKEADTMFRFGEHKQAGKMPKGK